MFVQMPWDFLDEFSLYLLQTFLSFSRRKTLIYDQTCANVHMIAYQQNLELEESQQLKKLRFPFAES